MNEIMKKNILVALTASLFAGSNISAQVFGDKDMILLATQRVSLGYQDTVFYVPYLSNTDVTVESDASWITAEVNEKSKKILYHEMNLLLYIWHFLYS